MILLRVLMVTFVGKLLFVIQWLKINLLLSTRVPQNMFSINVAQIRNNK